MPSRPCLWRLLALLAVVALACGCAREGPELLALADVAPRVIAGGDRVELLGAGFPEGKPARVVLQGDLMRPGQMPLRDVSITATGRSESASRVAVDVDAALERELCGVGVFAAHTTFRGRVSLAFSPRVAGAPPVSGSVDGVVLDVASPPLAPELRAARIEEARRFLGFIGLELRREANGEVAVARVLDGGRAAAAGLLPGDVLIESAGVLVQAGEDLVPPPTARSVGLTVRRGLAASRGVELGVEGFRPLDARSLGWPALVILSAASALVAFVVTRSRWLSWLERRLVSKLRDARPRGAPTARRGALERWAPSLAFVVASGLFAALALGRRVVAPELDLPLLLLASATCSVVLGLVVGGARAGGYRLLAGLRGALAAVWLEVPVLGGALAAVLASHQLRLAELVGAQGPLPWSWAAFRSPPLLVLAVLWFASLVPARAFADAALPESDRDESRDVGRRGVARGALALLDCVRVYVVAGIGVALFFGGWAAGASSARVAGVMIYELKVGGLVAVLAAARWALPRLAIEDLGRVWLVRFVPASVLAVGAAWIWTRAADQRWFVDAERVFGIMCVGGLLSATVAIVRRLRAALGAPRDAAAVNPWL